MNRRPHILLSLDSSWWNRLGFSRFTYGRMLRRAGCKPRPVHFRSAIDADTVESADYERLLRDVDGILLSGGGDLSSKLYPSEPHYHRDVKPLRDYFEWHLLDQADEQGLPVLGVCRGAQMMNVHRGGTNRSLRSDPDAIRIHRQRGRHRVRLTEGSKLAAMVPEANGELTVSSYHAHVVDQCGDGLRRAAEADGGITEAIESTDDSAWRLGVQWHPEWMRGDRFQQQIMRVFRDTAAR